MTKLRELVYAGAELGLDDRSFGDWSDADILIYSAEMIGDEVDLDHVSLAWRKAVVTAFLIGQERDGRSLAEITRTALRLHLLA